MLFIAYLVLLLFQFLLEWNREDKIFRWSWKEPYKRNPVCIEYLSWNIGLIRIRIRVRIRIIGYVNSLTLYEKKRDWKTRLPLSTDLRTADDTAPLGLRYSKLQYFSSGTSCKGEPRLHWHSFLYSRRQAQRRTILVDNHLWLFCNQHYKRYSHLTRHPLVYWFLSRNPRFVA